MNLLTSGSIPEDIIPYFFGGRLIALNKKDGGIRPIVIGLVYRRLISKLIAGYAREKLAPMWSPLQLGLVFREGVRLLCMRRDITCDIWNQILYSLRSISACIQLDSS